MESALFDLRVLELGQWIAAPHRTAVLADLGANVIKIERPGKGDDQRHSLPTSRGSSAYFQHFNRNKRSVALDLTACEDIEFCRTLIAEADVLVENFRPGVVTRLGLDYETLSQINPRLIYCSISGFGQTGPLSKEGGFDLIAQAASGIMSVTEPIQGRASRLPLPIADVSCSLFAAIGIMAALQYRNRTGKGQHVDASLLESAMTMAPLEVAQYLATGVVPRPTGEDARNSAPYGTFNTADGAIVLAASSQQLWERTCTVLEVAELIDNPQFSSNANRVENQRELSARLEKALAMKTSDEWIVKLRCVGVPAGKVMTFAEALDSEHIDLRGLIQTKYVPEPVRQILTPVRLSASPVRLKNLAPNVGQDTEHVRNNGWGDVLL